MRLAIALASIAVLGTAANGSTPAGRTETTNPPVIRISTELVQLDAVVTDKKGHHVTDLRPQDFEILQDGRPQEISRLSYVRLGESAPAPAVAPEAAGEPAALAPGVAAAGPGTAPRTIVFLVDDLGLSPESFARTRWSLRHVVKRLAASDRVALVTTARGFKELRPTTDHKAILAAIDGLRRTPWTREQLTTLFSSQSTFFYLQQGAMRYDGTRLDDWNSRLALQSIAVIRGTVKELRPLPGRKALLLISEGFSGSLTSLGDAQLHDILWPVDSLYGGADDVLGAVRRLGDFAARAAVVIDAVDPRGLITGGLNAEDTVPGAQTPGVLADAGLARRIYIQHSQGTLQLLPDETGGLALLDNNDLSGAMASIVSDLSGYYLIGYQPASGTFSGGGFHHVTVKVKRPGLSVRSRKGFFAVTDQQVADAVR